MRLGFLNSAPEQHRYSMDIRSTSRVNGVRKAAGKGTRRAKSAAGDHAGHPLDHRDVESMRKPVTRSKPAPARAFAPVRARPRFPVWLIAVLLALVTIVLYWPATGHDFVNFDDNVYVLDNSHVTGGLTWQSIRWAFSSLEAGFWHPLTWLSILADSKFYGLQARGYHLTGVLLHAANTVLLFLALQRMMRATWRSAFVGGLFGLHPLHVESVAWVSERKDVLSGFFWMLSLLMYVRYAQQPRSARPLPADAGRKSIFHPPPAIFYLLSLAFFLCGLMSKPMVATLPLMLILLDWWPLGRMQFNTPGTKTQEYPCAGFGRRSLFWRQPLSAGWLPFTA